MRIHQLPIGARFEYQGEEFVKTGPLVGTCASGQRLIPRHAVLRSLASIEAQPELAPSRPVMSADVVAAFEAFYAQCLPLVPEDRRAELANARDGFLKSLGER